MIDILLQRIKEFIETNIGATLTSVAILLGAAWALISTIRKESLNIKALTSFYRTIKWHTRKSKLVFSLLGNMIDKESELKKFKNYMLPNLYFKAGDEPKPIPAASIVSKLLNSNKLEERAYFIQGNRGYGKTSLVKYICYEFLYKKVRVNDDRTEKEQYGLCHIQMVAFSTITDVIHRIDSCTKKELLIIDGYDEFFGSKDIADDLNVLGEGQEGKKISPLEKLRESIQRYKRVVITSRIEALNRNIEDKNEVMFLFDSDNKVFNVKIATLDRFSIKEVINLYKRSLGNGVMCKFKPVFCKKTRARLEYLKNELEAHDKSIFREPLVAGYFRELFDKFQDDNFKNISKDKIMQAIVDINLEEEYRVYQRHNITYKFGKKVYIDKSKDLIELIIDEMAASYSVYIEESFLTKISDETPGFNVDDIRLRLLLKRVDDRYTFIHMAIGKSLVQELSAKRKSLLDDNDPDYLRIDMHLRFFYSKRTLNEGENDLRLLYLSYTKSEKYGALHELTLSTGQHLAKVIYNKKRYADAEVIFREVYSYQKDCLTLGTLHELTLATGHWLGATIFKQERYDDAEDVLREVYSNQKECVTLGVFHKSTLATGHWLGATIFKQERYDVAEDVLREVYSNQKECVTLGVFHKSTLATGYWLAQSIYEQEHYDDAEDVLKEVYSNRKACLTLGALDEITIITGLLLANSIYEQERYANAQDVFREVYSNQKVCLAFGALDELTLTTGFLLANSMYNQELYADAEAIYREVYSNQKVCLGFGALHESTLTAGHCLANSIYKQERYIDAEVVFKEVYSSKKACLSLGALHKSTLRTGYWLGCCIGCQKRFDDARGLLIDVYTKQKEVLGEDHKHTVDTKRKIDDLS